MVLIPRKGFLFFYLFIKQGKSWLRSARCHFNFESHVLGRACDQHGGFPERVQFSQIGKSSSEAASQPLYCPVDMARS
jgi:hypothetical protein